MLIGDEKSITIRMPPSKKGETSAVEAGVENDQLLRPRSHQDDGESDENRHIIIAPMDTSNSAMIDSEQSITVLNRPPYLPCSTSFEAYRLKFKGSIRLAFLSHACFITASLFYVMLGFLNLAWFNDTKDRIPHDMIWSKDDEVWASWAAENNDDTIINERDMHVYQTKLLYTLGAIGFVAVGFLDWMRFCDYLNAFMILAGISGIISGISYNKESTLNCVSVHLYFLEAINLLHRDHDYEGYACFRLSDVCFLLGSMLDVGGCYIDMFSDFVGVGVVYMDLVASFLWLGCAVIDLAAELYYLKKHKGEGECLVCY